MATITKRDNGKWQAKIRRKGYKTQTKTFATKRDAKRWVREIETQMDQSIFKSTDVAEDMLVSSALERYWDEHLINAKSADNILSMINRLKKVFAGLTLIDVTVHTIRDQIKPTKWLLPANIKRLSKEFKEIDNTKPNIESDIVAHHHLLKSSLND
ncbi:hypothetical protein [Colwellia sp. MEBiC06753]